MDDFKNVLLTLAGVVAFFVFIALGTVGWILVGKLAMWASQ